MNPHQIDAALFAMRSPVSKGTLLADEVGLGKTIEAGLAICQHWAERRRRILVTCPASIRKQWALELEEKFHLPCLVLDAKTYRDISSNGTPEPFIYQGIVICSMHFASSRAAALKPIQWDLVVIDEAHKLRNAYRESNRMGQNIRWALEDRRKILLTATPLQNSLLEVFGLSTLIDEHLFGDLPSFRSQYTSAGSDLKSLRERLTPFCTRTLRSQVIEYIQYAERRLIIRPWDQMILRSAASPGAASHGLPPYFYCKNTARFEGTTARMLGLFAHSRYQPKNEAGQGLPDGHS